jgi:hypothetical protein
MAVSSVMHALWQNIYLFSFYRLAQEEGGEVLSSTSLKYLLRLHVVLP